MRRAFLLILVLPACVDFPEGKDVRGSPADATTSPGDYTAYRVITDCANDAEYGVIGAGSATPLNTQAIVRAGQELRAHLETFPSVWSGGSATTTVCTAGVTGTELHVDDWRDVDAVIAMTGDWLHAHDLALEVAIFVDVPAVAHAQ
jgi:hypothetical protein